MLKRCKSRRETRPELAPNDANLKQHFRARLALLYRPADVGAEANGAADREALSATDTARKG